MAPGHWFIAERLVCIMCVVMAGHAVAQRKDAEQAVAPTFIVNSIVDAVAAGPLASGPCETAPGNNVCTLRAAIMKANHYAGGGATIRFAPGTAKFTLGIAPNANDDETNGDLNIDASMTIIGNGIANTIIDGNGGFTGDRVFRIASTTTVTISGVTIQHGQTSSTASGHLGGGVLNSGILTLDHSAIIDNKADNINCWGGGIFSSGTLNLLHSTVSGNTTGTSNAYGGGIYSQGNLLISDSTISNNRTFAGTSSPGYGGGLIILTGIASNVKIINSTISGNRGVLGGGIYKTGGLVDATEGMLWCSATQ